MTSFEDFVLPGETVDNTGKRKASFGVYQNGNKQLISSVAGLRVERGSDDKGSLEVVHWKSGDIIPEVGDIVIAKIIKITQRFAQAEIICINDKPLLHCCIGIIRSQDVRELDTGDVKIWKCYRPGDIVKGSIISLGNQSDFYLSTAAPQFGVISATSSLGHTMKPIAWNKMQCLTTKVIESRKVAKVITMDT